MELERISNDEEEAEESPAEKGVEGEKPQQQSLKSKWIRTGFFFSCFFAFGLSEGARGPTLLDIIEIYGSSMEIISLTFLVGSIGSMSSAFLTGILFDKYPHIRYFLIFLSMVVLGLANLLYPMTVYVIGVMIVSFFNGSSLGALENGINVLTIETWRGVDIGAGLFHSIHFAFSVGTFVAPLLSIPFLSSHEENRPSRINVFYALMAAVHLLVAAVFFFLSIVEARDRSVAQNAAEKKDEKAAKYSKSAIFLVALMLVYYCVYIGLEYTLSNFLTAFAVESELGLSKAEGAEATSIFWGCFALTRFLGIFAAMKLTPAAILTVCFSLITVSNVLLSVYAQTYAILFQVCVGGMGLGMGPIYAAGMTWLEQFMPITNKICGALTVSVYFATVAFPLGLGQFITDTPMVIMHTSLVCSVANTLVFVAAVILVKVNKSEFIHQSSKLKD